MSLQEKGPMADFAREFDLEGDQVPPVGFVDEAALRARGEDHEFGRAEARALQEIKIPAMREHLNSSDEVWAAKREAVLGRALPDLDRLSDKFFAELDERERKIWLTALDLVSDIRVVDEFRHKTAIVRHPEQAN